MAYRDLQQQNDRAKRLYIEHGVKDFRLLVEITGVPDRTLRRWKLEQQWDEAAALRAITPADIALRHLMRISEIMDEMDEKRRKNLPIAKSVYDEMKEHHEALFKLDAKFQVNAMIIRYAESFVDFVAQLQMENKEPFVAWLERTMPLYIDYVTHSG